MLIKNAESAFLLRDSVLRTPVFRCGRWSVCGLAALGGGHSVAFHLFPPPALLQFTICRWKNVDVELPNVNACSGARTEGEEELGYFFWVQFFAQRLHGELHVSASFFTYRWQRHDWSALITSTYFQKALNYIAIGLLPHARVSNMSILSTLSFVYPNQVFPRSNDLFCVTQRHARVKN